MIETLSIERFKSIRSLSFSCKRVNLFIGAPDTGKTNILDALHLLSRFGWNGPLDNSFRVRPELGFDTFFYRQFFDAPFEIKVRLTAPLNNVREFVVRANISGQGRNLIIECSPFRGPVGEIPYGGSYHVPQLEWIRFYAYATSEHWQYNSNFMFGDKVVTPPHGSNLIYIARHNAKIYEYLVDLIAALNWRLRFDPSQKTFRLSDVRPREILDYNIDILSDSVKRLFFYGSIIHTSQDATLVLDEPDVFAFPPYPRTLGEMIAYHSSNQFFLTTHNPYFLASLAEKTPAEDFALFICHRDPEGGTALKQLSPEEVSRVIEYGSSVFFNLGDFLE